MIDVTSLGLFLIAALTVALFFLAFLPQFTDPTRGAVALQMALLGLIFTTSGTRVNRSGALLSVFLWGLG